MLTTTDIIAPKKQVFRALLRIYDVSAVGYRSAELYFRNPKSEGSWTELMLRAQNSGLRLAASAEWYKGWEYAQPRYPEIEKNFIEGASEWTGTVLDFDREELLEGIVLNPDGSVADAKIRLGKKQGVLLPYRSNYVTDLDDKYMRLVSHLWGVEKPKRELPDDAFLRISPGFRPVFRGGWSFDRPVVVHADYDAAHWLAARFVSEAKPESMTPQEYETLSIKLQEAVVLIE